MLCKAPILSRYLVGSARVIGKPIESTIFVNGSECRDAKIFIQHDDFYGSEEEYFILYFPNKEKSEARNVVIVDKKNNLIRIPNSNRRDYEVIGKYLFQSESGANVMIPVNGPMKGMGFEPDLIIKKGSMEFKLPNWSEFGIKEIKIKI